MSKHESTLYTVNAVTGEVVEGWNMHRPGWYRTLAATPDEARESVIRGHLVNARGALAFEQRAPLHLQELHTLEQARAFLEGHVPGCSRFDLEAQHCPCSKVDPATVARVVDELRRTGPATQEQLARALGFPPLVVRGALLNAADVVSYIREGFWKANLPQPGDRQTSVPALH